MEKLARLPRMTAASAHKSGVYRVFTVKETRKIEGAGKILEEVWCFMQGCNAANSNE